MQKNSDEKEQAHKSLNTPTHKSINTKTHTDRQTTTRGAT